MKDEVRREVEQLLGEKTKALRARYLELFEEELKSSNHAHLFRRVARRLQALSDGGLTERARNCAAVLAVNVATCDCGHRAGFGGSWRPQPPGPFRDPRLATKRPARNSLATDDTRATPRKGASPSPSQTKESRFYKG